MSLCFTNSMLFEINKDIVVNVEEHYIYIDNIYKNYQQLKDYLVNINKIPRGKQTEYCNNYRNILCEHSDEFINLFNKLSIEYFNTNCSLNHKIFINTQNVKKDNNLQHWPHYDYSVTSVIYLDNFENGGTALYDYNPKAPETTLGMGYGYLRDTSMLNIINIIPAKPNRMIMFDASKYLHGGYILDKNIYIDNQRITQAIFGS